MTKIYLVRHVEYANPRNIIPGRLPVEISEEGFAQAHKLRKYFEDKTIKTIYASKVLRVKQTAEIISSARIPIVYDERLLETLTVFQGFPKEEWNKYGGFHEGLGGETYEDVHSRVAEFLQKTKWERNTEYIIVSHGDPLYFLVEYIKGQKLTEKEYMDNINKYGTFSEESDYQTKGSVRIITKKEGDWKIGDYIQNNDL